MTASAYSQIHTDTICLNKAKFVNILTKAEQAKVYEKQIEQYKTDTALLSYRIAEKSAVIETLKEKGEINEKIIATYQKEINELKQQIGIALDQVALLNKKLRKEKRKRRWERIGGLAAIAGAFYIGTTL